MQNGFLVQKLSSRVKNLKQKDKNLFAYISNGIVFTFIGPSLFWLLYPLGPFLSVLATDSILHTLRFCSFKKIVFRDKSRYNVTFRGYLFSILPEIIIRLFLVDLLYNYLERGILTIVMAIISISLGYIISQTVFKARF